MGEGLFLRALSQLRGRARRLHLHVMGEPLLHPDLPRYLELCAEFGHRVQLVTNGVLLGERAKELAPRAALGWVSVSLQSALPGQARARIEAALAFAEAARAARGDEAPWLILRVWNEGEEEAEEYVEALRQAFGAAMPKPGEPLRDGARLGPRIRLSLAKPFAWPSLPPQAQRETAPVRGSCLGLRRQLAILCDGSVVPCCLDSGGRVVLGSIAKETLDEVLGSPRARAILEGFRRGFAVEPLCAACGYRKRFDGRGPLAGLAYARDEG
jgi:hypothetical protein